MNFNNIFEHKIETNKTSAYILQYAFLENFIKKVNDHTAKITQEMHELNFTSIYAEHSGLKYHLSNPCSRAASFKKTAGTWSSRFQNWACLTRSCTKSC